jgi:ribose-phosphate pyrophosphokinase
MEKIIFALPGNEVLAEQTAQALTIPLGSYSIRQFPDEETYVRLRTEVSEKEIILFDSLHRPDAKFLSLYFLAKLLKDSGARKITLVAPYLSYMRQDKQFHPGEAVTSGYFAALLSSFIDELITIDPHLHRRSSLAEIYSIPCKVVHASPVITSWIKAHIEQPLLVGPDSESEQWVSESAHRMQIPYIVLSKERLSDTHVTITVPDVSAFKNHTPVLVDDIISTANTMIVTAKQLIQAGLKPPVCIGIHAIFAGNSYAALKDAGAGKIITCNTIPHESNAIDVSELIADSLSR